MDGSLNFSHVYAHVVSAHSDAAIMSSTGSSLCVPFRSKLSSPKGTTICYVSRVHVNGIGAYGPRQIAFPRDGCSDTPHHVTLMSPPPPIALVVSIFISSDLLSDFQVGCEEEESIFKKNLLNSNIRYRIYVHHLSGTVLSAL